MKSLLIIYSDVPNEVKAYLVREGKITKEEHERILKCHSEYFNLSDDPDGNLTWLCDFLNTDKMKENLIYKENGKKPGEEFPYFSIMEPVTVVITGFVC